MPTPTRQRPAAATWPPARGLELATFAGARVLGLDGYGLEPGCHADLTLVPAETIGEAVVAHPARSLVVKRGRLLAQG